MASNKIHKNKVSFKLERYEHEGQAPVKVLFLLVFMLTTLIHYK